MRLPTATYRVQLNGDFNFRRLTDILDYLSALGVSDIYASPIFAARPGSTHGYDVCDPNRLNPELGSAADWQALTEKRQRLEMGWLQDIVPNHMAYSQNNAKLKALFELGPRHGPGDFFDITWNHPHAPLTGRLSAPFLGAPLEQCLDNGELTVRYDADGLFLAYYEHRFPLALKSYGGLFDDTDDDRKDSHRRPDQVVQWLDLIGSLQRRDVDPDVQVADLKNELWHRFQASAAVRDFVTGRLNRLNHRDHRSALDRLLEQQFFYPDFWQNAAWHINYRRFFYINDLIAVRQEDGQVFEQTHELIGRLIREGVFTGLRVDHVDGLLMPGIYLDRLRRACGDCYLIVEKILTADETLPGRWPVEGTTGYEFAAHLDRLFTDAEGRPGLDELHDEFCCTPCDFETVVRQSKAQVLKTHFSGDLDNLAYRFRALLPFADEPPRHLTATLSQIVINLRAYRTYRSDGIGSERDAPVIEKAVSAALRHRPDLAATLMRIDRFLTTPATYMRAPCGNDPYRRARGAFEQLCAAMAAKGVEDTALYRFHRLTAHNEVGGDPQRFAESPDSFHRFILQRMQHHPHALNSLSTHDSKRSGDVRARLLILSEMAETWETQVRAWQTMHASQARDGKTGRRIDTAITYLLFQTLVATCPAEVHDWPAYTRRIKDYMRKAAREAKRITSWTEPEQAYESALDDFVGSLLHDTSENRFLIELRPFAARVARFGRINTLARTLIQLTAPGIPDIYQGTELYDDSLVDPDNRRPVDFARRRKLLDEIRQCLLDDPAGTAKRLITEDDADKIKLYLIHVALGARQLDRQLFAAGQYRPVSITGLKDRHAVAFARVYRGKWSLTAVPRFYSRLNPTGQRRSGPDDDIWQNTRIELPADAPGLWRNLLTCSAVEARDGGIALNRLLTDFPVALLAAED